MFDYQAGERQKMTLIMTALAGMIAGVFFTLLLASPQETPQKAKHRPKWTENPDVTGVARPPGYGQEGRAAGAPQPQAPQTPPAPPADVVNPTAATELMQSWLPLAWDFSAASALNSQEHAIQYMTPDCAQSYRQNVWTTEMANEIAGSGVKSTWHQTVVSAGGTLPDGGVEVTVQGEQQLMVPGQPPTAPRAVKFVYLIKKTKEGLRIAGISEGGPGG
jgi:hypothetical protein